MRKILSLLLMHIISIQIIGLQCVPTFGDEFVHIKVHLPKETGGGGIGHVAAIPYHHAPPPHKVIHHFHQRRRRPHRKPSNPLGKHSGLVESLILSEVKKPISADHHKYLSHANDIAKHVGSFKSDKPAKHVDTYTLIEETVKIPKETVETFKVIETKPVPNNPITHSDAFGFNAHNDIDGHSDYNYNKQKSHAYKAIDTIFDDFHSHYSPYISHKTKHRNSYDNYHHHVDSDDDNDNEADNEGNLNYGYNYNSKYHHDIDDDYSPAPHHYSSSYGKHSPIKSSRPHYKQPVNHYSFHKYVPPLKMHTSYHYEPPTNELNGHHQHHSARHEKELGSDHSFDYSSKHYGGAHNSESSYLSTNHQNSGYKLDTSFDDQTNPSYDAPDNGPVISITESSYLPPNLSDTYVPPPLPSVPNGADAQWSDNGSNYKATETYVGIDSYSAPHVQGFGSGGYKYPSDS